MPHLQLSEADAAPYVLLPGDPARLDRIALHMNDVTELAFHREFRSIRGFYKGVPLLAVSTGLGGPSAATAVEELSRIGVKYFIRIGSCGALQSGLALGDLLLVQAALRHDGTSSAYAEPAYPAVADYGLLTACQESAAFLQIPYHIGLCRSHDSLYTAQKAEMDVHCSSLGVLGSDMETAAILVCASLKGLHAASILNVVVEYKQDLSEHINQYSNGEQKTAQGEQNEILTALEALVRIEQHNHLTKQGVHYEKLI